MKFVRQVTTKMFCSKCFQPITTVKHIMEDENGKLVAIAKSGPHCKG